ncbi:hypothetical protein QT971_00970 [Microcoleus sp. herbarium19]|uniref:hypothetical protein n=1 Tax=unclassified Microcoleus TaxID=2642155 RepID=UPI002FD37F7A
MMQLKGLIFITAIAALFTFPSAAVANDQDVQATTIPASACRPESDTADASVRMVNGAFIFNPNSTGTVRFFCPLPINRLTVSNPSNDNDLTGYRVYYRDTDGTGNLAAITTHLFYRNSSAASSIAVGAAWSSNSNPSNLTVNTSFFVPQNHQFEAFRLYFFVVTMRRNNINQDPAFGGIDFVVPQVP